MAQKFEYTVLDMIESASRQQKTAPLNLGGTGGLGGGAGAPPGGFIGQLPQYRVAYDMLEDATMSTMPSGVTGISGWSLVDNLNHIRYRLGVIESGGSAGTIIVQDWDGSPTIDPTSRIIFSGATVVDMGGGTALVVVGSGGGSGSVNAQGWQRYMLSTVDPSISTYYLMSSEPAPIAGLGGGVSGSDYNFARFISSPLRPSATSISEVSLSLTADASSNLGGISVDTYVKLYKRNPGGTETLLGTSNTLNIPLSFSYSQYNFTFSGTYSIATDDRLVIKLYGTVLGGSPAYTFVNMYFGGTVTRPGSHFDFKADFGSISGIYFSDEFNNTVVQSGILNVDFNEKVLKYQYLRLDTDNGKQEISRQLVVNNDQSGESVIYGYSTGDAYTAEFDQITDTDNVYSPTLYLYQETGTATIEGQALYGYRSGTHSLFTADWVLLEDDYTAFFRVDTDGNVLIPSGSRYMIDGVSIINPPTSAIGVALTDNTAGAGTTDVINAIANANVDTSAANAADVRNALHQLTVKINKIHDWAVSMGLESV